jgi:hypothetical protein
MLPLLNPESRVLKVNPSKKQEDKSSSGATKNWKSYHSVLIEAFLER